MSSIGSADYILESIAQVAERTESDGVRHFFESMEKLHELIEKK